jgi:hypothetical protein
MQVTTRLCDESVLYSDFASHVSRPDLQNLADGPTLVGVRQDAHDEEGEEIGDRETIPGSKYW